MPINASVVLTYEVQSLSVDGSGGCTVLLSVSQGTARLQAINVQLDAATCAPVWAGVPAPGIARWPELKAQLYALLKAAGSIPT